MQRVEKARKIMSALPRGAFDLRDQFHESEPEARLSFVKNVFEVLDGGAFSLDKMRDGFKACGISSKLDGLEDLLASNFIIDIVNKSI